MSPAPRSEPGARPPWAGRRRPPWAGQRRPAWWPEDQPWPPGPGRRRPGPWLLWRMGCLAGAVLVVAAGAGTAIAWLLAGLLGVASVSHGGRLAAAAILVLLAVAVLGGAGRVRRLARPMSDLVAAAGRIEAGDYSARVTEHGPSE